jgi:hypothetical protein
LKKTHHHQLRDGSTTCGDLKTIMLQKPTKKLNPLLSLPCKPRLIHHIKEDKTMVGYTPTAFLHSPLIWDQFKGFENTFVLTTGKDFVGVCNFTSFQDMGPKIFNHFNQVTQILRFTEHARHKVTLNGAKETRMMYAHGFRSATTGTGNCVELSLGSNELLKLIFCLSR